MLLHQCLHLMQYSITFLQVRAYIFELERHLSEAHRQASRLVRHQNELSTALEEFGTSMKTLGRFEEGVSFLGAAVKNPVQTVNTLSRFRSMNESQGKYLESVKISCIPDCMGEYNYLHNY